MVIADLGRKVEGELLGWRVAVGAAEAQLDVFVGVVKPKSVIRISLCRTAKRNPLIFPI